MDDHAQSGLSFVHLNVGSLLAAGKLEQLKIQTRASKFDIFSITESWLSEGIPTELIDIRHYNVARLDRGWREGESGDAFKKGGGLVCYIKDSLQFSDTEYAHLNCSCRDLELQWVQIKINSLRPIVILNA